jgi:hypothetical protein
VNGQVFEGQGRSKKLAKHAAAAEAALRSFVQFKNAPEAQQAMNMHITDLDFTSDVTESEGSLFNAFQPPGSNSSMSAGNTEPAAASEVPTSTPHFLQPVATALQGYPFIQEVRAPSCF